ncbi:MAG: glycosyltransferase [Prevotella sp.]|nr:glycosyltransferase [Prevotella sp.]
MKIAFYLPNSSISKVDFSNVDKGNPGIGGSEYSVILIASNLCKRHIHEIIVYCDKESIFPVSLKWQVCKDFIGAIKLVIQQHIDYLIVDGKLLTEEILCRFSNVKFIAWANTFIPEKVQDVFAKMDNVVRIVNVGKEELEQTKDHQIYEKSTFIYNAVPTKILDSFPNITPNAERNLNVCYIGSLHAAKGFQYLAKAWPKVIEEIPEAQLYVIGSGKLYGRNNKLGKWNIANEEFEEMFMPYLTEHGKIIPSVHFLGILGEEKYSVLEKCKVGVPNPSGISETFGYTAVEMEFMDCQVTTIKCPGYMDTVCQKENLYENTNELSQYIIRLLKNNNYDRNKVLNYIDLFSVDKIIQDWEMFFIQLNNKSISINIVKDKKFYLNTLKYYFNRSKKKCKTYVKALIKQ